MFKTAVALIVFSCIHLSSISPETVEIVRLTNASFEGTPQDATVPVGWLPCAAGSTPDILPGPWGVYTRPFDGETYIGLITREDGSAESIGQRLTTTLKAKECYDFSIRLAHSKSYSGYNLPIKLKIWGGTNRCDKTQLLGETEAIRHTQWKKYDFTFSLNHKINYIILEAQFADGVFVKYRGNLLLDDCSLIQVCKRA